MTAQTDTQNHTLSEDEADRLIASLAGAGRAAMTSLSLSSETARNRALHSAADIIRQSQSDIMAANQRDIERARHHQLSDAFIDRLTLTADRIEAMASGLVGIAGLNDPLGQELARWQMPNGLDITRITTPLGLIGVIYESRPNVTVDAAGLCIKSGNSVLLRGGSDSQDTSQLLASLMQRGLEAGGLDKHAVQIIPTPDRQAVGAMLRATGLIDVIVPRGGKGLVGRVQSDARVPVFAHLEGICHLYIAPAADREKAISIAVNAKMRRVGICGAAETILVDRAVADTHLPGLVTALAEAGCEVRGDSHVLALCPDVTPASGDDFGCEFLAPIVAMAVVDSPDDAIAHISTHGSGHTESIITEDTDLADRFLAEIDSAIVMVNASTQFADGGEFGMGAEIGIATGRMHARGPIGAAQLTSFKYAVRGDGQIRG